MSEQIIPQNQDEEQQNANAIEGEEIAPEDLEGVAGGGNSGCTNIFCADN